MGHFCFTVDDNIRCLKELSEGSYGSLFEHPYLGMYRRLHRELGVKVQLNLFYESGDFALPRMTDRFAEEWQSNADWLKLSFHSRLENLKPYLSSGYDEVFSDCRDVHREILRFASEASLAKTTTIHYCYATKEGLRALSDNGVTGLLGLYGGERVSYERTPEECAALCRGEQVRDGAMTYARIDLVLNCFSKEEILAQLAALSSRDFISVMIHEQYFYPDYHSYQPDFEEKLAAAFTLLNEQGRTSLFLEERLNVTTP